MTERGDATWMLRLHEGHAGPRVAVKDLFDVAGTPTTAGCQAVARRAGPATGDAACLAGLRSAMAGSRARLVGKTNLHELADGITGINWWSGTPVNPLDPGAVPGGSSSGSAVAVATGQAEVAYGTDTAGSVRIPAACCGVVGLKTTWGRIAMDGVWPLAPSLDTVGPLAADVATVMAGMDLLEEGFAMTVPAAAFSGAHPAVIGRIRLDHLGIHAHPVVDAAVDRALAAAGWSVHVVRPQGWAMATAAALTVIGAESFEAHGQLVRDHLDEIGADVAERFAHAAGLGHQRVRDARFALSRWGGELRALMAHDGIAFDALALPTMGRLAPALGADAAARIGLSWTLPISAAGLPALALPLPLPLPLRGAALRASLQLVGGPGREACLCALGRDIEASGAGGR